MDAETVARISAENIKFAAANLIIIETLFSALLMQPRVDGKKLARSVSFALRAFIKATDDPNLQIYLTEFARFVEKDR